MKRTLFAATLALLLWGSPALAGPLPDFDSDGVLDSADNCSDDANPAQDDTDGDACGNICDADYDGDGGIGFLDFGVFSAKFGSTDELYMHVEPVDGDSRSVGFLDFGYFSAAFSGVPGPSGTTVGTTACP
jgi:hypothetical protein